MTFFKFLRCERQPADDEWSRFLSTFLSHERDTWNGGESARRHYNAMVNAFRMNNEQNSYEGECITCAAYCIHNPSDCRWNLFFFLEQKKITINSASNAVSLFFALCVESVHRRGELIVCLCDYFDFSGYIFIFKFMKKKISLQWKKL